MQFVIAGGGEIGISLTKTLLTYGHQVILIEKNPTIVRNLNDTLAANIIEGDIACFSTLKNINWENCNTFLAVTRDDTANLIACKIAKLLGTPKTICRLSLAFQQEAQLFNYQAHFSIDYILAPQRCCAIDIAKILRENHRVILEQFSQGSVELRAIKVGSTSGFVGKKIIDLALCTDLRIGLIQRDNDYFIPTRDTVLQANDILTLSGTSASITAFSRATNPEPNFTKITLCSASETTLSLLQFLQNPRFKVKVIESSMEACQKLSDQYPNVTVIHGDATSLPLLQEELMQGTDYFIACSGDDEKNIIACLQGKRAGAKDTILCINKEDYVAVSDTLAKQLSISHITMNQHCIWQDLQHLLFPQAISTIAVLGHENPIEIVEINIPAGAEIEGLTIDRLSLPDHCLFLVLKHKFRSKVPAAHDILLGGDCIIAAVQQNQRTELIQTLTRKINPLA